MTKCKFCKEWKKPATIMGPICGYCKRHKKKPVAIMETICGYCNEWWMLTTMGGPYAGIAKRCQKYQRLLWDLDAGIATDAKNCNGYYGT